MKLDDFRIGVRHLVQEPVYSAIAVLGRSIGLAACLLLLGFVPVLVALRYPCARRGSALRRQAAFQRRCESAGASRSHLAGLLDPDG